MKFCQIEIVKSLNSINNPVDRGNVKREIAEALGISIDIIDNWIADGSNSISSNPILNILGFFDSKNGKNNRAYNRIRKKFRSIIIDRLFNSSYIAVDNRELNDNINNLIVSKKVVRGYNEANKGLFDSVRIYKMGDSIFNEENDEFILDYLMINHMDLLINSWLKELVACNNGVYTYNPEYNIRTDYNSEKFDEQEPDVNALIKVLLDSVDVSKFKNGIKVDQKHYFSIEKNAFLYVASNFMNKLSAKEYKECVDNPYYILEVIKNKYKGSTTHSLEDNVLASFVDKYLFDLKTGDERNFLRSFKDYSFITLGFSPLDIFINAFTKYMPVSYIDQNVDGTRTIINNINGDEDNVIIGEIYNKICNNIKPVAKRISEILNKSNVESPSFECMIYLNDIFPFHINVTPNNKPKIDEFLLSIKKWYSSSDAGDFVDWIKDNSNDNGYNYGLLLREIISSETGTNTTIISGSRKNISGKMLPISGINTVAGNIKLSIARNETNKEKLGFSGKTVYSQGFLFNDVTKDRGELDKPIFNGTIYLSSLFAEGLQVKEFSDLSFQEQFKLSFLSNFYNGWKNNTNIYIEAITPSDKKRIPLFDFNAAKLKNEFGSNWQEIERNVISEMQSIHAQYLLNVLNGFSELFNLGLQEKYGVNYISDMRKNGLLSEAISNLLLEIKNIEDELQYESEESLNNKINQYNINNGKTLLISKNTDYVYDKSSKRFIVNPFLVKSLEQWISPYKFLERRFAHDLNEIRKEISILEYDGKSIDFTKSDLSENIKQDYSDLYTFFLISIVCSENVLINTVGLPYSHKHGKPGDDIDSMDTSSHITMVKRMAALTATSHTMQRGVLTGQPTQIKTMSWYNDQATMTALSGKSTDGNSAEAELDLIDGLMISTRISDNLTKQSIGDVKPSGNAIKYLIHDYRPDKCASRFTKMASNSIDNAYIRSFGYKNGNGINPKDFIMLQLSGISIDPNISIDENGDIVGYDGCPLFEDEYYFKKNGVVVTVSDISYDPEYNELSFRLSDDFGNFDGTYKCNNDLFSIWNNILGGENSCDINGELNESSMDEMTKIVNVLGEAFTDDVSNQSHVNQYAKKQMIMYFPTQSTEKALQPLTVDLKSVINSCKLRNSNPNIADPRCVTETNIDYFGIQLNPDHEAENSKIHEITQMMSYLAEKGLVHDKTANIYKKLVDLINVLANSTFVDKSSLMDNETRAEYKENIDKIFGKKILRVFSDPNLDVISLSNEICREINKLNIDLLPPYSDHQFLMKLHTTVGSYFNKFIARDWPGRGDVLMGSSGLAMILEDEDGIKYLANGEKGGVNIQDYLNSLYPSHVNNNVNNTKLSDEDVNTMKRFEISKKELEPLQMYYIIRNNICDLITINNHTEMMYTMYTNDDWDALWESVKESDDTNKRNEVLNLISKFKGATYYKALNVPRNLKTKNMIISNGSERVNIWHFKTHIDMIEASKAKNNDLYKELSNKFAKILEALHRLSNGEASIDDLVLLNEETGLILSNKSTVEIQHDEKLSTNPYGSLYGDNQMVMSEIHQKGSSWFLENLKLRCPIIEESRPVFYSTNGTPIVFVEKDSGFKEELYTRLTPVIDEDGYLIDKNKGFRFVFPDSAKVYNKNINGINVTYIVADKKDIDVMMNSKSFVYYRNSVDLNLKNVKLVSSDDDLAVIAEAQYKDWKDGNLNMVSRIPAQALSFGMIMETVGYLPWKNNVSMVNDMHVYMEGSDYDIDKIFMIFKSFSNNGLQINKPYYRIYTTDTTASDLDMSASIKFNELLNEYIISNLREEDTKDIISEAVKILEYSNIYINVDEIIEYVSAVEGLNKANITKKAIFNIIKDIQRQISLNDAVTSLTTGNIQGLQNLILDDIKSLYDDPRTLVAATTPTTMAPINSVVKKHGFDKLPRYHHSITTNLRVNRTTSVGKAGVGISANGQKAAYAIEYYNSLLYNNNDNMMPASPYELNLPSTMKINGNDWAYLIHPGAKLNQSTYNALIDLIITNGKAISKNDQTQFNLKLGQYNLFAYKQEDKWFLKNGSKYLSVGQALDEFNPTDIISSLISSCTDNAKEMKIDLINGTEETLPGYIYCILIGMDIDKAFTIFKRPIVNCLINEARGDLYLGSKKSRIIEYLTNTKDDNIINFFNKYDLVNKYSAELEISPDKALEILKQEWDALKQVFQGAQAITSLSSILGINGGIGVNFGEPTLYRYKVNKAIGNNVHDFDIYDFIFNGLDNEYYINRFGESNKESNLFNILKIISYVPHYHEMIKVPLQFENTMRIISKDYDNVVNISDKLLDLKAIINSDLELRKIARYVNDRKIHDFFVRIGFQYLYEDEDGNVDMLSTASKQGLLRFKKHVEEDIYPRIKDLRFKYEDNAFIQQLSINSRTMPLFGEKINYIGLFTNLNNPDNLDSTILIKDAFYQIQDEIIDGNTVFDWLFLYDLLVNKHTVGANNITQIFDNKIELDDKYSLVRMWVEFINEYDNNSLLYQDISNDITRLGIPRNDSNYQDLYNYGIQLNHFGYDKALYQDPDIFPLYIHKDILGLDSLFSTSDLFYAFKSGKIIVKRC